MIDLHCHILPAVDDGSDSMDTSCQMAAMAADSGVRTIVATPHSNLPNGRKNYRSDDLLAAFRSLQAELDRWQIPIRILPGAEILIRGNPESLIRDRLLQTLNDSRYLLVEFYFDEAPDFMTRQLMRIGEAGLIPVIAHPERYFAIQQNPSVAQFWADQGWVLQVNKGSILGNLGEGAYETAAMLLRRNTVGVIASDAHHFRYRTPRMDVLLEELADRFPEIDPALLLLENPRRIVSDRDLIFR